MEKPLPSVTADTQAFWDGCAAGELRYQSCMACGRAQFPPALCCGGCGGALEWKISSGKGVIFSLTQVHRAPLASFRDETPYVIALIDFDEGFRMMMNILGSERLEAAIGRRISILFEARGELFLPQARIEDI